MDLYNILNIKKNASQNEIRQSYLNLVKIYHPDKNKSNNAHEKFIEIQTAYEILYNLKSKNDYNQMDMNNKIYFHELFKKIIKIFKNKDSLKLDDIKKYFNKLCDSDCNYIKENFSNFIHDINIIELFDIFYSGKLVKKTYNIYTETESDNESYNEYYYYILPLYLYNNNDNNLNINIDINIEDILNNNIREIKIKRKINNIYIISKFIFNLTHPYIVFYNSGDICNNISGHLIIKLILPNNIYWNNNILFIDFPITLFELIYGIDNSSLYKINKWYDILHNSINNDSPNNLFITKWIPFSDSFSIDISKHINIIIKLYLNYEHNENKYNILKQNFNN
jgi:curved DNA-binding protein CbpA